MEILTQSSLRCFRTCPRQYQYRYEMRLGRERTAQPLRFGSAFHLGLEIRQTLGDEAAAIEQAAAGYDVVPGWADPFDWAVERETLRALLAGHFWFYGEDNVEVVKTEGAWEIPLENPETRAISRTYALAGKIDKIVRMPDGRLAVMEYKTSGEDISDDSDYWPRLRCDAQISAYVYAARKRGHDVQTVLYDVTRKPEISPKLLPVLDDNGRKIVVDADGNRCLKSNILKSGKPGAGHGDPYESVPADKKDAGWQLRTTRETPEQFGQRLLADIGNRPEFYFARRDIPRLQTDLDEFAEEVFQQSQQLHQSRKRGLWFRNVSPMTCRSCSFASICLQGVKVDPATPPAGFVVLDDAHPELTGEVL